MRRLAIVSTHVPPFPSGQSVALGRILASRPAGSYVLVATRRQPDLRADTVIALEPRFGARVLDSLLLPLRVGVHSARIARAVRRARAEVVVGCTGDLWELPIALIAARRAGADFVAYCFDDYVYQWPSAMMRAVARRIEPFVLRRASCVIVPNEALAQAVRLRTGVTPELVRNPASVSAAVAVVPGTVVYAGSVYGAQADSVRRLVAALELVARDSELHVYSATSATELEHLGLGSRVRRHEQRAPADVAAALASADVLFLPLSAGGVYHPKLIQTSSPGKLGEYLAAGRPVLAHVPAGSFVESYLTDHDCGLVVAEPSATALAAALERLFGDQELRARLAQNAVARAEADFALPVVRRAFAHAVGESG